MKECLNHNNQNEKRLEEKNQTEVKFFSQFKLISDLHYILFCFFRDVFSQYLEHDTIKP